MPEETDDESRVEAELLLSGRGGLRPRQGDVGAFDRRIVPHSASSTEPESERAAATEEDAPPAEDTQPKT